MTAKKKKVRVHDCEENAVPYTIQVGAGSCCDGLKGMQLAWHKYSAHGGPYPKRSRRSRGLMAELRG